MSILFCLIPNLIGHVFSKSISEKAWAIVENEDEDKTVNSEQCYNVYNYLL